MTPSVTVCLPTYNQRTFLVAAIESAVTQDHPALEVVVADDGSTDGTYELAESWAARRGDRVRLLPRTSNRGLPGIVDNYNRALAAASGDYVAFLEGDDYYLPGKIARQVAWLQEDASRVLCGHDVEAFRDEDGATVWRWSERFGLRSGRGAGSVVRLGVPFCTVSVMVRRSAIPARGFDGRMTAVLDWKFWIDCLAGGGSFGFVPGVYARYRRHGANLTTGNDALRAADVFKTLALVLAERPELAADVRAGFGRLLYADGLMALVTGDDDIARRRLGGAWRLAPLAAWRSGLLAAVSRVSPAAARAVLAARGLSAAELERSR
jgi:glycosyltransferase involved in cell wall biosynthesis